MEKIETLSGYDYNKLFDALKDKATGRFETVGKDDFDGLILHTGVKDGSQNTPGDGFFIITPEEYTKYLEKARKNGLVGFFEYRKLRKCAEGVFPRAKGKITSFEYVTLRTSGMRSTNEYEILMKDGKAELSLYSIRFNRGESEDDRVLEKRAVFSADEALGLLNRCNLLSWDGFNGPHPKGVLDGIMFRFKAKFNGETTVTADGSENFPRHYRDFTDGLYELLDLE